MKGVCPAPTEVSSAKAMIFRDSMPKARHSGAPISHDTVLEQAAPRSVGADLSAIAARATATDGSTGPSPRQPLPGHMPDTTTCVIAGRRSARMLVVARLREGLDRHQLNASDTLIRDGLIP
jgi:hypothetical protein